MSPDGVLDTSHRRRLSIRLIAAAFGLTAAAFWVACAREEPPPGARPDRVPPSVREVKPPPNAIVPGFSGSVEVRFDEPITGTTTVQQNLVASPADRYQVSSGFSNIKIRPADGWADGVVYYFRIPQGIGDLLGNRTEDPIELVFSTGPELSATRVTGEVRRRVDGQAVSPGSVLFYNLAGDSIPYGAVTDRQGAFELVYLPPDEYWSFGFQDLNNNLRLERLFEPYDSVRLELADAGTADLAFRIIEPDTTPPVLGLIRDLEPGVLELEFDDYLDPEQDFSAASLVLRQVESGARWQLEDVRLKPPERRGGARRPREPSGRAAPDTAEAPPDAREAIPDTAEPPPGAPDTRPDTTEAPGDTVEVPTDTAEPPPGALEAIPDTMAGGPVPPDSVEVGVPEGLPRRRAPEAAPRSGAAQADTLSEEELPSQTLRIQLAEPLTDGAYRLTIDRILNLRLLEARVDTAFTYPLGAESDGEPEGGTGAEEGTTDTEEGAAGTEEDEPTDDPEGADEGRGESGGR